ncbi:MAG: hypothetical protein LBI29_00715 [Rickettsiales bacterium]|jgi:hypothetical protein|nr:hypothetical protein [Rickettsiales bacterium]
MKKIPVDDKSAHELRRIRKIIDIIIESLEERISNIKNGSLLRDEQNFIDPILGKDENVLSAVCKLGNLMVKLGNFEVEEDIGEDNISLEDVDLDIIHDYIKILGEKS